ncbi:hypothetical protein QQ045_002552 [Rhodiola kirilowii]
MYMSSGIAEAYVMRKLHKEKLEKQVAREKLLKNMAPVTPGCFSFMQRSKKKQGSQEQLPA